MPSVDIEDIKKTTHLVHDTYLKGLDEITVTEFVKDFINLINNNLEDTFTKKHWKKINKDLMKKHKIHPSIVTLNFVYNKLVRKEMNIFYVPPLERPDECKALEENYMNCLMQKAMKDKVFTNRCVMDSLLWFHLECPKASSKFDDPVEFKRKWRNFFAYQRASAEMLLSGSDEA